MPLENIAGRATFIWWSYGPDGVRTERIGTGVR